MPTIVSVRPKSPNCKANWKAATMTWTLQFWFPARMEWYPCRTTSKWSMEELSIVGMRWLVPGRVISFVGPLSPGLSLDADKVLIRCLFCCFRFMLICGCCGGGDWRVERCVCGWSVTQASTGRVFVNTCRPAVRPWPTRRRHANYSSARRMARYRSTHCRRIAIGSR